MIRTKRGSASTEKRRRGSVVCVFSWRSWWLRLKKRRRLSPPRVRLKEDGFDKSSPLCHKINLTESRKQVLAVVLVCGSLCNLEILSFLEC